MWILLVFLFVTLPLANSWSRSDQQISLAVYPLSEKTADLLRQKLQAYPSLHIVDPKNVDAVLKYYQNYRLASDLPSAEQAEEYLARAKDHYFQLSYAEAKAELEAVFQIFQNQPELIFSDGILLFDSWMTLGLIHAASKKPSEAVASFQEAYRIHPNYAVDPKSFAPSVRRLIGEAKDGLKQAQPFATLKVNVEPKVTEIYLNGIYQGVSPKVFTSLPSGEHALTLKAQHYRPLQQHLLLEPHASLTLQHKLVWQGPNANSNHPQDLIGRRQQIEEGLRVAELLKVDKVLLVQADKNRIQARLVDRQYRASHKPIAISLQGSASNFKKNLERGVRLLYAQTQLNLLKKPYATLDPEGVGDPILLGSRRRRRISKGVLFGGLGAAGVGGILAAVLARGGSSGSNTGSIALSFR